MTATTARTHQVNISGSTGQVEAACRSCDWAFAGTFESVQDEVSGHVMLRETPAEQQRRVALAATLDALFSDEDDSADATECAGCGAQVDVNVAYRCGFDTRCNDCHAVHAAGCVDCASW